jgi:predicted extracellular nuclease
MLVRVENGTVASPTNQFNEASVVAKSPRAFREPGILFPGLPGLPVWDGNPEIFEIDTDRYTAAPGLPLAGGATVTAEGPLAFSFGDYQIWPTSLEFTGEPAIRAVRARGVGEFTVGSQNVLRLFDTDDDPDTDDPLPTPAQYAARLAKLSLQVRSALGAPDVLAVQEVENLGTLQDLAAQIHTDDPAVTYAAYLLEGNDVGGIDVGFLVRDTIRVDTIDQFGLDDVFEFGGTVALLNDRPPLVLRGAYVAGGANFPIVVINVHQRSLSGIDGSDGPRVRAKRHAQALRLSQFIDELQDAEPDVKLVVIGDFNAFEFTDGYVDVMGQVTGTPDPAGALLAATDVISADLTNQTLNMPAAERYSFVFDGNAQSLDHVLTSQRLEPFVRGAQHSRGNADAPFAFDTAAGTPLRSADHDGTVLFVTSDTDADGVPENLDHCPATVVPEAVPTVALKQNHYALVDADRIFDTLASQAPPVVFTLDDTAGCSCEQILDRGGRATGERRFGCSSDTMTSWISSLR